VRQEFIPSVNECPGVCRKSSGLWGESSALCVLTTGREVGIWDTGYYLRTTIPHVLTIQLPPPLKDGSMSKFWGGPSESEAEELWRCGDVAMLL
jgi:hypothetical protein